MSFLHADFTAPLSLVDASFDLLISLFTVPAWQVCHRYVKPGGLLLANASHGEASLAALDPQLTLVSAVHVVDGQYSFERSDLESYLIPKKPALADPELIRSSGRGIDYTRPAFAYLFQLR